MNQIEFVPIDPPDGAVLAVVTTPEGQVSIQELSPMEWAALRAACERD